MKVQSSCSWNITIRGQVLKCITWAESMCAVPHIFSDVLTKKVITFPDSKIVKEGLIAVFQKQLPSLNFWKKVRLWSMVSVANWFTIWFDVLVSTYKNGLDFTNQKYPICPRNSQNWPHSVRIPSSSTYLLLSCVITLGRLF